jgi:excisionase family DNA binding protein
MNQESMLKIREVADYLHVVPLTVYRMISRGDLQAVKAGRVWRIRQRDLNVYLDRATSQPNVEKGEQL